MGAEQLHTCTNECSYVHAHTAHTYMQARVHSRTQPSMPEKVHTCLHSREFIQAHTSTCLYVCTHKLIDMRIHTHAHTRTYARMQERVRTRPHMYAHTHLTHTHTYTNAQHIQAIIDTYTRGHILMYISHMVTSIDKRTHTHAQKCMQTLCAQ